MNSFYLYTNMIYYDYWPPDESINESINKNDNIYKAMLKKSPDQTNIYKYRVAVNIMECHSNILFITSLKSL